MENHQDAAEILAEYSAFNSTLRVLDRTRRSNNVIFDRVLALEESVARIARDAQSTTHEYALTLHRKNGDGDVKLDAMISELVLEWQRAPR